MTFVWSKLGMTLATVYGLVASVVLYFNFTNPKDSFWEIAVLLVTLPWSVVVVLLGFALIHVATQGMQYGFVLGAMANFLILYFVGAAISLYRDRAKGK